MLDAPSVAVFSYRSRRYSRPMPDTRTISMLGKTRALRLDRSRVLQGHRLAAVQEDLRALPSLVGDDVGRGRRAERGGIVMLADIAMRLALRHGHKNPPPAPRKKRAKSYRIVK